MVAVLWHRRRECIIRRMICNLGLIAVSRYVRVATVLVVQLLPRRAPAAATTPVASVGWRCGDVELAAVVVLLVLPVVVRCRIRGKAGGAAAMRVRAVVGVVGMLEGVSVRAAGATAVVAAVFCAAALDAAAHFFFCYFGVDDTQGLWRT